MFPSEPSTKISDLPIKYKDVILEQALCVPLSIEPFDHDRNLEDLCLHYELDWGKTQARLQKLCKAALLLEEGFSPSGRKFVIDTRPNTESRKNPIPGAKLIAPSVMAELIKEKDTSSVYVYGKSEIESYSAALYFIELGFSRVGIYTRENS